jgi:creatinine amidohydrolase/Fe(II)-dependent formamide hydrolase-like protein
MRLAFVFSVLCLVCCSAAANAAPRSFYLEDLTWTEVRDALAAGTNTIIIPAGGTEQNGPHMALGKHNARVRGLSGKIAAALGDALVAPVLAYVPEGRISPPTEHMRFPGTISIPDAAFKSTLDAAARSFKQAGFTHVVLLGDSGNYQGLLRDVAAELNRAWAGTPAHAHFIDAYYQATQAAYVQALRAKRLSPAEIGTHAGTADTSLLLAVQPDMVRADQLSESAKAGSGVLGDPRPSSAALGQLGVDLIVTQTVAAIRKARTEKH